jgi:hypothetical protein
MARFRHILIPAILLLVAAIARPTSASGQCGSPRIDCPADIAVTSCSQNGIAVNYPLPTAANDCGPLTPQLEVGLPSGEIFPPGTTHVGYMVVDENGAVMRCGFDVVVTFVPDIQLTCPDDITVYACDDGGAIVEYAQPTAFSPCIGPVPTQLFGGLPSGALFPVGTHRIDWINDSSVLGYSSLCTFNVTVLPNIPFMNCPRDTTVTTCDPDGVIVDYAVPTAGSSCGPLTTSLFAGLPPGSRFPLGVNVVQWVGSPLPDGSRPFCIFHVTVEPGPDTEPPVILCPDDIVLVAAPGQASAVPSWEVKTSDDCPGDVTVVSQPPSGSAFGCGTTPVLVTARDAAGNESTCSFRVTVGLPVPLDIRPGGCPNPVKAGEGGVIPVAVMGSSLFDVATIDPASLRLQGVAPLRWTREDAGAPFLPFTGRDDCLDCNAAKKDRIIDLALKFDAPALVAALGKVTHGECRVLRLTGTTTGGCPVVGEDVVRIQVGGNSLAGGDAAVTLEPVAGPAAPALHAALPNPLTRATGIDYELPAAAHVRLEVFDVVGRRIRTLVDAARSAGRHAAAWDGVDQAGVPVPGGVYFYALTVDGALSTRQVRKLIVSR